MDSQFPPTPENVVTATVVPSSAPPMRPQRRSRPVVVLLVILLLLGLFASGMLNLALLAAAGLSSFETDRKVRERFYSHEKDSDNKVAVITVEGTIISAEGFIKRQIDRAKDDSNLKAIVLRIDSPGGTIAATDALYYQLRKLRQDQDIPLVVSMGSLAASGGYYLAMACGDTPDVIFAERSTWTGSIGVIIPHYNFAGLMKEWGIEEDSVTSHPLKNMASIARPMTEQERGILQGLVDDGFAQFKDIVKRGRPAFREDPKALDELATGQVFTAAQAEKNGLVDKIGFLEDAVDRAIALAGLSKDDVKVVRYRREPSVADVFFGNEVRKKPFDLATMLEMTAPRGYYLWTWLPSLVEP